MRIRLGKLQPHFWGNRDVVAYLVSETSDFFLSIVPVVLRISFTPQYVLKQMRNANERKKEENT